MSSILHWQMILQKVFYNVYQKINLIALLNKVEKQICIANGTVPFRQLYLISQDVDSNIYPAIHKSKWQISMYFFFAVVLLYRCIVKHQVMALSIMLHPVHNAAIFLWQYMQQDYEWSLLIVRYSVLTRTQIKGSLTPLIMLSALVRIFCPRGSKLYTCS